MTKTSIFSLCALIVVLSFASGCELLNTDPQDATDAMTDRADSSGTENPNINDPGNLNAEQLGINREASIKDLSAEEQQNLCRQMSTINVDLFDDNQPFSCTYSAMSTIQIIMRIQELDDPAQTCQESLDSCSPTTQNIAVCDPVDHDDCDVSVAELETCFNDVIDSRLRAYAEVIELSCQDVETYQSREGLPLVFYSSQSCEGLNERCHSIFGD